MINCKNHQDDKGLVYYEPKGPHKYSRRCSVCGKFLEWVSEKNAKKEGVQDASSNRSADSTGSLGLS